jgi:hypothetical protein
MTVGEIRDILAEFEDDVETDVSRVCLLYDSDNFDAEGNSEAQWYVEFNNNY